MNRIASFAFSLSLLLAPAGGAAAQGRDQSCPKKTAQNCAKAYRICLASCTSSAGFGQDECRYRCCEENRACLVAGDCDAAECGD